jgi:hypothetical protein
VRERIPNPRSTLIARSTECSFLGNIFPAIALDPFFSRSP